MGIIVIIVKRLVTLDRSIFMVRKYKIWTPGLIMRVPGKNERVSE